MLKGETPLDLAYQSQNRFIVFMLKEEERMRSRRNNRLLQIVEKYEVISSVITVVFRIVLTLVNTRIF